MKELTDQFVNYIDQHLEESFESAKAVRNYIEHSTAIYHGIFVRTMQIPKMFPPEVVDTLSGIVKTTYGILDKVIKAYREDEKYRATFPFSKELEELILLPTGYECNLPIARFDIFYNEETGDFKFCEINTDGTSAMNEDYELNKALQYNTVYQKYEKDLCLQPFELYDSWVKRFMEIYNTYENKVEHPHVAIVDFMEKSSKTEFEEFERRFEKAGYSCEICEVTKLTFHDGKLYSPKGKEIHAIYRRAVTSDIMKNLEHVQPLIQAVKEHAVCMIGGFCTQLGHHKWLFKALHEAPTQAFLTKEEIDFVKKHIPYTNLLADGYTTIDEICLDKDRWILKPVDSYAAHGVFIGMGHTHKEWREIVTEYFNKDYLCQEYYFPYKSENYYLDHDNSQLVKGQYINLTGMYSYGGELAGIYSRMSKNHVVGGKFGEYAVASLKVKKDMPQK